MGRTKKTTKNYKKNKTLQSANAKKTKIKQGKARDTQIKEEKLIKENLSDSDREEEEQEQQYLRYTSKTPKTAGASKDDKQAPISKEEIEEFLNTAREEGMDDIDEQEIAELISGVDDDDDEVLVTPAAEDDDDEDEDDEEKEEEDGEKEASSEKGEEEEEDDADEDEEAPQKEAKPAEDDESSDEEDLLEQIRQEEAEAKKEGQETQDSTKIPVTKELINAWIGSIKKDHSLKAAKKLSLAFFAAVYQDVAQDSKSKKTDPAKKKKNENVVALMEKNPFVIQSHEMFLRVVIACGKYFVPLFDHYTKRKTGTNRIPEPTGAGWKIIQILVKSYLKSACALLKNLLDAGALAYFLKYFVDAVPYMANFMNESRVILKNLLNLLGNTRETVRFRAFLLIHQMAITLPYPFLELCLKGIYFTLVQNARFYDAKRFKVIEFLKSCIVELYGIDAATSYQHAYVYIRELAINLRRALEPEKLSYTIVYNWRFINCVDAWVRVLCAHQTDLKELVYPLAQILLGACEVRGFVEATFVTVRLKFLDMINKLMKSTDVYIPSLPIILELFEMKKMTDKAKTSAPRGIDFEFGLKIRDKLQETREYQNRLREEAVFLLIDFLSYYSKSVAFPELAFPAVKYLKRYLKKTKKDTHLQPFIKRLKQVVTKLEDNTKFINEQRMKLTISPAQMFAEKKTFLGPEVKTPLDTFFEVENRAHAQALLDRINSKVITIKAEKSEDDDSSDDEEEQKKPAKRARETKSSKKEDANAEEGDDEEEEKPAKKQRTDTKPKEAAPAATEEKKQQKKGPRPPRKPAVEIKKSQVPKQDVVKSFSIEDF